MISGAGSVEESALFCEDGTMYEQISTFTSLLSAYYKARRCKRYNDSILRFGFFLESNVEKLSFVIE